MIFKFQRITQIIVKFRHIKVKKKSIQTSCAINEKLEFRNEITNNVIKSIIFFFRQKCQYFDFANKQS